MTLRKSWAEDLRDLPGSPYRKERLLDPPDVSAEDRSRGERAVAEVEVDCRTMNEAKPAIYPWPKFQLQFAPRFHCADQCAFLHIFIEPALRRVALAPGENLLWALEKKEVAIEEEEPATAGKIRRIENLQPQRVLPPVFQAERIWRERLFHFAICVGAFDDSRSREHAEERCPAFSRQCAVVVNDQRPG